MLKLKILIWRTSKHVNLESKSLFLKSDPQNNAFPHYLSLKESNKSLLTPISQFYFVLLDKYTFMKLHGIIWIAVHSIEYLYVSKYISNSSEAPSKF